METQNIFSSGDTDPGGIVGVEADNGEAWCFECADAEIRRAGETAFSLDLYRVDSARRKCANCKRRIGEVNG